MKYKLSIPKPHTHFVEIEYIIENNQEEKLLIQLPAWRPGRYELQNFAKNIQKWLPFDDKGNLLVSRKTRKDTWEVETKGNSTIVIKYNYYAYQLDAGACWLDENQLYINPVHCMLYVPERIHEACTVQMELPEDYEVACGLPQPEPHTLVAEDYHQLVDSPFIASDTLIHNTYEAGGVKFHLWFQGLFKPEWERLINDFAHFSLDQIEMMGEFPAKDFHFLIQVPPYNYYHGVEHLNSTVLAIGPGYKLQKPELYVELMGLASHELFHSWNIKSIRPAEMMPYDYTRENYSRLGYVCEGITTYYGDLFLYRSGVFDDSEYFKTFNQQLQKHFDNYGRFNLSVADSSFDTWLDGYVEGIPYRKTSIYTEGCLLAFVIDILIRKNTGNQKSLDDVMRLLYYKYAKNKTGYTESDYQQAVEETAGNSFDDFFKKYLYGTTDYTSALTEALAYLGLELVCNPSPTIYEDRYGFRISQAASTKITHVAPGSPADTARLSKDDEIVAINGIRVQNNLKEWMEFFGPEDISLSINSSGYIKEVKLEGNGQSFFPKYKIARKLKTTPEQKAAFESWSRQTF